MKHGNSGVKFKNLGTSPEKKDIDFTKSRDWGTVGWEPPVRREDLDEEGKKIWDSKRAKKSPAEYKSPAKQEEYNLEEEQVEDLSGPRRKVVGPATEKRKGDEYELIEGLRDKIEFITNDISEGKVSKEKGNKLIAGYRDKISKLN